MTTADQSNAPYASELQVLSQATELLDEMQRRIGPRFRRAEVRRRVRLYVGGLLAQVERKNGWQLAEALGEHGPHGVQRLLSEADWGEEAVRDELRAIEEQRLKRSALLPPFARRVVSQFDGKLPQHLIQFPQLSLERAIGYLAVKRREAPSDDRASPGFALPAFTRSVRPPRDARAWHSRPPAPR